MGRRRHSPRPASADVPVLLSVGYAACHWCHVMAHESFEDAAIAGADERAASSASRWTGRSGPTSTRSTWRATQALTGHGGWPMTVFLTPDGRPFYAGTYFPPEPRHGMPGFSSCSTRSRETWASPARRGRAGRRADRRRALAEPASSRRRRRAPIREQLDAAARSAGAERDAGARRLRRRTEVPAVDGAGVPAAARAPAPATPERSRWSPRDRCGRWRAAASTTSWPAGSPATAVDAAWVVPHFEKMLYDNALLRARLPALVAARPGRRWRPGRGGDLRLDARRAAAPPRAGFASALDADTGGRARARPTSGRRGSSPTCSARTTASGRPSCCGDRGRHRSSTARRRCSWPATWPTGRGRAVARVRARAAGRAGDPAAAGPGRQGGGGLERAGGRGAGRDRRAAGPAGPGRRGASGRRTCCCDAAPGRRPAAAGHRDGVAGDAGAACWRTTPTWPRGCSRCTR